MTAVLPARPCGPYVVVRTAANLQPEPVCWLWPGWLARGTMHVLAGPPGTGKSTIAFSLAAAISGGHKLPDGRRSPQGRVVIWSGEDEARRVIVPRLIAAGADLDRVLLVEAVRERSGQRSFDPAADIPALTKYCRNLGDVALLIVDPLVSAVAADSHKNAETRRSLQPLVDLATSTGAAVLGITHYSKGTNGRDPTERVTGSLAFGALARIVWGVARQPTATQRFVLARAKSNLGVDGGGYSYSIAPVKIDRGIEASRIVWGEKLAGSAHELLTEPDPVSSGRNHERQEAADWLRNLLRDGPLDAREVRRLASEAGLSWRTVQRAMGMAGIETVRNGFPACTSWRLPSSRANSVGATGSGATGATEGDHMVALEIDL